MILFVGMLIAASIAVEIAMVRRSRMLRRFLERGGWRTLVFSMGLSWLLGAIFGAAGMVVMTAGLVSTVVMQPVYWVWRKYVSVKKLIRRR